MYRIKRHRLAISAHLRRSLVLTYAVPPEVLKPLLYPQLELDTFEDSAFVAVAMVETQKLRPSFLPPVFGIDFFLIGYRIFVRYKTRGGKSLRGLQILRSETNSRLMVKAGNLLTRYRYGLVRPKVKVTPETFSIHLEGSLDVTAHLSDQVLPEGSVFADAKSARRFEGPMPFTFSYEHESNSMLWVEGVRQDWDPKLVRAEIVSPPDFGSLGIDPAKPKLVSAFFLENVPYRWKPGVVESLS